MNNLDYICEKHRWLVASILDSLSCEERGAELDKTLALANLPEDAMAGGESMSEWLASERVPGAWQPFDSPAEIMRDVAYIDGAGFAWYLRERGIAVDECGTVIDAAIAAIKDVNLRWALQHTTVKKS